ncbi:hypothetical protein BD626DRAFT_395106 [Schizophyllum amplum]|uniref:VTT domain-containing protein n=1 Tax=Schizophyllum amplum TaxID=97359 RepID=A0A550CSK3_9AGAR|nr:hypothetical protein BD626DRAFT_395106 [Auriculariopsis ampla]
MWHLGIPTFHSPILVVMLLFPLSSILIAVAVSTLPVTFAWPRTLQDLAQLGRDLHAYSQSGPGELAHVLGVLSATAVWKHAWSIPGSVIWNVLAGALFSPLLATILLTLLTTLGSLCSTLLATPLAPIITYLFPRALELTRQALGDMPAPADEKTPNLIRPALSRIPSAEEASYPPLTVTPPSRVATPVNDAFEEKQLEPAPVTNNTPTWIRLSILRLIGVVPWSGINIACGVCGVSLWDCMLGNLVGSLPWTAVTCQVGDILQTFASNSNNTDAMTLSSLLASREIIVKLILLSVLSLAPILGRDWLRAWASGETSQGVTDSPSGTASLVPSVMSTPMLAYAIPSFVSNGIPAFAQPDQGRQPGEREWQWRRWFRTLAPIQRAHEWVNQDDVQGWRRTLRDRLGQPTPRQNDAHELRTLVDEKRRMEDWEN